MLFQFLSLFSIKHLHCFVSFCFATCGRGSWSALGLGLRVWTWNGWRLARGLGWWACEGLSSFQPCLSTQGLSEPDGEEGVVGLTPCSASWPPSLPASGCPKTAPNGDRTEAFKGTGPGTRPSSATQRLEPPGSPAPSLGSGWEKGVLQAAGEQQQRKQAEAGVLITVQLY